MLREAVLSARVREESFEEEMVYSDIGFLLLGFILDKITGDMESYLQEKLFIPLDMTCTGFNPSKKELCVPTELTSWRGLVQGQVHDEKAFLLGGIAGHAGLFSSLDDLINFAACYSKVGYIKANGYYPLRVWISFKRPLCRLVGWRGVWAGLSVRPLIPIVISFPVEVSFMLDLPGPPS